MARAQQNLIYALKNNEIVSIDEVESGLKCGCVCPACNNPLIAKKGTRMQHHFAHHAEKNCEYGYESSLHLAAKTILLKAKTFALPPVYIQFPNSNKKEILIKSGISIPIDRVELEHHFGNVVPDVVIYSGKKQLFVEIYVTHKIDEHKLNKLKAADISTIEIDLSKKENTISPEELSAILLNDVPEKQWIFNSVSNKYLERFLKSADYKKVISRKYTYHVDDCPLARRTWHGKPYANLLEDCLDCEYCISHSCGEDGMLCSGRLRISTLKDFETPEDIRIQQSNKKQNDEKWDDIESGYCPYCKCQLVERESSYGKFWGCSNYPHCRFKISIDHDTGEIKMHG